MLEDKETEHLCGIFHHRAYQRFVSPGEARDFNSGRCKSYEWFEKEEQPTCPLSDQCGAYVRPLEMRAQCGQ
jgi:hypothetical protein